MIETNEVQIDHPKSKKYVLSTKAGVEYRITSFVDNEY